MNLFPRPVLDALAADPGRTAIQHGTRAVSADELLGLTGRVERRLREAGLGPGSGVAVAAATSPETYAAHLAAHALGCRVAALRPGWSAAQLAHVLREPVDALIADAATMTPELAGAGVRLLSLGPLPGAADLLRPGPAAPPEVLARPDDVARLTFTSGSTGLPKACAQTYRAHSLAYQDWPPVLAELMTRFERCLVHGTLASPVMMTYAGRCLVAGGTVVVPGPGEDLAAALGRHAVTAAMMPPPRLGALLSALADGGPPGLRALVLGGAPAGPSLLAAAAERLGPVIWQGYGQAEAGVITMLTPADVAAGRLTSVGRPLPGVRLSLRDRDERPVGPGEVGEVWVRSPHRMAGYWRDPEGTREVLRDDGWLRTRDLGRLDGDGMLHLTGRTRDVIIVNAEVCYAGAVEAVLAGHPAVEQAFVVGAPDLVTGEAVHAYVVPAGRARVSRDDLAALVRDALGEAAVPRTVTTLAEAPVNEAGKPDKSRLKPG
ncbi:class I adenylate-forming enzyme family protein [Nonomuraea ceibae]|uniref:class I adenylate-forming enzyme family protein n=1 Tax=Nonomuraea ceibae TaxID=1935170 RepID=UPI001C5F8E85|nr:fatty acid--CoA ligase family protein [Nonomuraea ceibae]